MSKYWENFYKKKHTLKPSSFAKFVRKFISDPGIVVYDLGCGNGRDSYYLGKKWEVFGIDDSFLPKRGTCTEFIKSDVLDIKPSTKNCLMYMRFFVHSISDSGFCQLLSYKSKYIAIEVRSNKDKPIIYPDHKRYLRSSKKIIDMIHSYNYELVYFIESTGVAKYKNEDPVIIRIIAQQK